LDYGGENRKSVMAVTVIGCEPIYNLIMAIEYKVRISERQRKLVMRALTAAVANNRRSTDAGFDAAPDEWMELIGVFAALNSHETVAASKIKLTARLI
jgi:hypothetical protein